MSLYNMLFGVNSAAPMLLAIIGLDPPDIPRFRDCFVDDGFIVVHTRTGGGNREYYEEANDDNPEGPWNSDLQANPNYVRDEDDDYDCTYANFYFSIPEDYKTDIDALCKKDETYIPSEKWMKLFDKLRGDNK